MTYSYSELYIDLAQRVLGDMLDYAVNTLKYNISEFHKMFIGSGMSHQFEIGNPTYIAGKNGCEIARCVIEKCGLTAPDTKDIMYVDKSSEYWIGWALAYYQWISLEKYEEINIVVPIEEMYNMYPTFHEADISLFVETMNQRMTRYHEISKLKRLRSYAGLSQSMLSKASDVPLRQIQLFEQGQRSINKTQGDTLQKLAKSLNCQIEDLL